MMSLCRSIHTLLGFQDRGCRRRGIPPREERGLRYVIEEAAPPPPPAAERKSPDRGDPGAWGLHEAEPGLCTESLGAESCDGSDINEIAVRSPRRKRRSRIAAVAAATTGEGRERRREFPPPLAWLSGSRGRRSCFMKGERRDGRFLLTEVTIERPEVLRASRQDGRLRLHLIDRRESQGKDGDRGDPDDKDEEEEDEGGVMEVKEVVPMLRCQEAVSGNGNMPSWLSNHRFVTTA